MIATLESHQIDGNRLRLQIKLIQLTAPYSGPVEIKLLSGDRKLLSLEKTAQEGRLSAELSLTDQWWGMQETLRVELVTPEGNTATIALPGTSSEERKHIQLCPLDRPVEASLAPFTGQEGTRAGFTMATGGCKTRRLSWLRSSQPRAGCERCATRRWRTYSSSTPWTAATARWSSAT